MGNLLGSPMTEKETHSGRTPEGLKFAVSSMQGWRVHMEDAHICQPFLFAESAKPTKEIPQAEKSEGKEQDTVMDDGGYERIELPGHSLYAVFDGHGGSFSAEYAARNLCRVLSRQPDFVGYALKIKSGEKGAHHHLVQSALRATFLDLDREILREVKKMHNPDANVPYGGDGLDSEYHGGDTGADVDDEEDGENSATPVKMDIKNATGGGESTKNGGNGGDDDSPEQRPEDDESGTTVVLVVVTPDVIICANAGDSRSVMSREGRTVMPLSFDHKPDDYREERRIQNAGGTVQGGRVEGDLAVSRGLGDFRYKEEDTVLCGADAAVDDVESKKGEETVSMLRPEEQKVSPIPEFVVEVRDKEKDKFIVLACDGIWDVKSNLECIRLVDDLFSEGEADIGLLCEEVLDDCLTAGSKDNMTVLVVQMESQKIGDGGGVATRREKRSVYVPPHKDPAYAAKPYEVA